MWDPKSVHNEVRNRIGKVIEKLMEKAMETRSVKNRKVEAEGCAALPKMAAGREVGGRVNPPWKGRRVDIAR